MKSSLFTLCAFTAVILAASCNSKSSTEKEPGAVNKPASYKEEMVTISADSTDMNCFLVYNENDDARRPAVLVVPEWWGLNDYAKMRVRKLAELGYIAMAVDVYGNGKMADNPDSAGKLAMPFYTNPQKAKARIDAAMAKIKTFAQTDGANVAAVGYCFGGGVLLNTVRLGDDLKGVVSFHGSLLGTPADKNLLRSKILVCHGNADPFVPMAEAGQFIKQMDSIGAAYTFKGYDSATHAFTNPDATAMGKKFKLPIRYNAAADSASWNDMKVFLSGLFAGGK